MSATTDTATWWAKRWLDRATPADKAAMRALLEAELVPPPAPKPETKACRACNFINHIDETECDDCGEFIAF